MSNFLSFLNEQLSRLFTKQIGEQTKNYQGKPLSPIILTSNDASYKSVEELESVLNLKNVNNIALTGGYGSGKSSIILTLENKLKEKYSFLRISLSTFYVKEIEQNDIEYGIVKHILYKSDPDTIFQTRFKRIKHISKKDICKWSWATLCFIFSFIVVFEPSWLIIDSVISLYYKICGSADSARTIAYFADYFGIVYIIIFSFSLFGKLLSKILKMRIHSFKAKECELTIDADSSIFDKYIDEIVYYFNASPYNIVIFEDLDRFADPRLTFLKLRELNILLNESETFKKDEKSIKFIYAIRDDLFIDDIRTKCFDYIIPVVPVIDSYNAGDYIIKYNKELFNIANTNQLYELGSYIKGMRELNNILNEYSLYKKTLKYVPSQIKLLAFTIYKNNFPADYALLHEKRGFLYSVISNKSMFAGILTSKEQEAYDKITIEIDRLDEQIKTQRKLAIDGYIQKYRAIAFYVNTKRISIEEFVSDSVKFELLRNNKITKYDYKDIYNEEAGTSNLDCDFRTTTSRYVNSDFDDQYNRLLINSAELDEQESKLRIVIDRVHNSSFKHILHQIKDTNAIKGKLRELAKQEKDEGQKVDIELICEYVQFLMYNGYLDSDYSSYLSFYHEGYLTENDNAFFSAIIRGEALSYDLPLCNIDKLCSIISTERFNQRGILNYSLFDYLIKTKKVDHIESVIRVAREYLDFIIGYSKNSKYKEAYIQALFNGWSESISAIFEKSADADQRTQLLVLFYKALPDIILSEDDKRSLGDTYSILIKNICEFNIEKINNYIATHEIVFSQLKETPEEALPVLDNIVSRKLYEITYTNLNIIAGEEFNHKAYTAIMHHPNKELLIYVNENIEKVVQTFPESSINEEPIAILSLANNEHIEDNWKIAYCKKQTTVLDTISNVAAKNEYIIYDNCNLLPIWTTILNSFSSKRKLPEYLKNYIVKHREELSQNKCTDDNGQTLALMTELLGNNDVIDIETYRILVYSFSETILPDEISNLDEQRVDILLEHKILDYSDSASDFIAAYSDNIKSKYIILNFQEFKDNYDLPFIISNNIAINILQSKLSLLDKVHFLNSCFDLELGQENTSYTANLICFYLTQAGISGDLNKSMLIKAITNDLEPNNWKQKIDLINLYNATFPYNLNEENQLLNSLGDEYIKFTYFRGVARLDMNEENDILLRFLEQNNHYINRVIPEADKNQFYITFRAGQ